MPIDREGVYIVGNKVHRELSWIFREQPVEDYGVDAHIEIKEGVTPTGKLIGVQIKTGPSYFSEVDDNAFVRRLEERHVQYWTRHSLPMILVLVDPDSQRCFWQKLDRETIISTGKGWKVLVPEENILGAESRGPLLSLLTHNYSDALSQLQLAYPFMELVEQEESFLLEAERWVNKTSGRTLVRLLAGKRAEEALIQEWPYLVLPGVEVTTFLREAFPWAELEVDEEFYEPREEEEWQLDTGAWDNETGSYLFYTEDFEEWKERRGLRGMRPYEAMNSEVEAYRFRVSLNEIGRAYLVLEKHLQSTPDPWLILKERPTPGLNRTDTALSRGPAG